jgi:hypothetical protein
LAKNTSLVRPGFAVKRWPEDRRSKTTQSGSSQGWSIRSLAARPPIARIIGGAREADDFVEAFPRFNDRRDTSGDTALYFVRGKVR